MKAMYIVGEDMALVDSNANHVHDVLSKLDFLVVQDIFFSRTANMQMSFCRQSHHLKKTGHLQTRKEVFSDCIKHCRN